MAIAFEHRRATGTRSPVRTVFARIASAWRRYRVERELEGMSFDLRKDIGFRSWDKTTR